MSSAMNNFMFLNFLFAALFVAQNASAQKKEEHSPDEMCLVATITGVGGPPPHAGKAQSGVFVQYGDIENGCDSVRLQFDAGRGTLIRLSQIKTKKRPGFVTPQSLDALFITHAHSDHTSSLPDIITTRWVLSKNDGQFSSAPPPAGNYSPLPVICPGTSCGVVKRATHMWDREEIPSRAKADYRTTRPKADIRKFKTRKDESQIVWESGDVVVSAIAVPHIKDSVGYLVSTPAGRICISGDTALSVNLVKLCDKADFLIQDSVHPVIKSVYENPPANTDPKFVEIIKSVYQKHTDPADLDIFSGVVANIVMTHMTPAVGAGGFQGIPLIPYLNKDNPNRKKGPLNSEDFCQVLKAGGYKGGQYLAVDLMKIKLVNGKATVSSPEKSPGTNCIDILKPQN